VEHRLLGYLKACARGLILAGVEVAVKTGEVAGRDFHPKTMTGQTKYLLQEQKLRNALDL